MNTRLHLAAAFSLIALLRAPAALATGTTLIDYGSTWKYLDDGSDQGVAWQAPAFDDSAWSSGPAQLGYGDGDEATEVGYGPNSGAKYITTYFRKTFAATGVAGFVTATVNAIRDDGAIVYLNGTEILRTNMPAGAVTSTTPATSAIGGTGESQPVSAAVAPGLFVEGANTIAVEMHQSGGSSSDLSFDLQLRAADTAVQLTRGPYLQSGTPSGVTVRWRTDVATDSRVRYGASPGSLTQTVDDAAVGTEHTVTLGSLGADTRYYYSVGTTTAEVAGNDSEHTFVTAPVAGTPKKTRVWVIGDSGTGDANAGAVRNAYDTLGGPAATDLWLMLGDNAYNSGTDNEFQSGVFNLYPAYLRRAVLWPTFGNHDAGSASSGTQSGPYYDIFNLPTGGQAGGVPSGTEAYYSFDYGNIHFVCLNSQDVSRAPGGAMLTWLDDDLTATTADWVIAFWHHPPYTKGSHNSDAESQLIDMRQNALPILESHGVDLVLTGHSHSYERSFLLDGHYGLSSSLAPSMILDGGDGRLDGSGAYEKTTVGLAANQGAVYAVAGSSGKISGGALNHPAMYVSLNVLGSMLLDVDHNVLQARFLNSAGVVADHFTVIKGGPLCGNNLKESGEACDGTDLASGTCAALGCSGGTLACAGDCSFDSSGCTGCTNPTFTPTPTPTQTPTPTPAGLHDSVVLPPKPLSITIGDAGSDVVKTVKLKVRNADVLPAKEMPGHTIRLTVTNVDCPAGIVAFGPDFDPRTVGAQPTIEVRGGAVKKAELQLRIRAVDFSSHNPAAPVRCTLLVTASTELLGNADPTASNNTVPLEINVVDRSDTPSAATHESVLRSARTMKLRVAPGASSASKKVRLSILNADVGPPAESPGHGAGLSVDEPAGNCPAGSVTVQAVNPATVPGGAVIDATVLVTAAAADFHSGNARSPARCVAVLDAATNVGGNTEPDPTNNRTRLVVQVDDRNDY